MCVLIWCIAHQCWRCCFIFQRLVDWLVYASRMTKSFEPLEWRTGPLGAKYNPGLLPKDRHKVPKFVNYWAPKGAQVSDHAYWYLIVTEGETSLAFIATLTSHLMAWRPCMDQVRRSGSL